MNVWLQISHLNGFFFLCAACQRAKVSLFHSKFFTTGITNVRFDHQIYKKRLVTNMNPFMDYGRLMKPFLIEILFQIIHCLPIRCFNPYFLLNSSSQVTAHISQTDPNSEPGIFDQFLIGLFEEYCFSICQSKFSNLSSLLSDLQPG